MRLNRADTEHAGRRGCSDARPTGRVTTALRKRGWAGAEDTEGTRTPHRLEVGREHEERDEPQAQRRVLVLPDHGRDQQQLPVAGQQQRLQQQDEVGSRLFRDGSFYPQESENAKEKGGLF